MGNQRSLPRQRINYDIRPSKSIQRKALLELLKRVHAIYDLSQYTYLGFGSYFFIDFLLFHRYLGLRTLVSIERDTEFRERFEFCKPLGNIELVFGESYTVLAGREFSDRHIIWLDYDEPLSEEKVDDVVTIIERARLGSVLLVTVALETFAMPEVYSKADRKAGVAAKLEKRMQYLGKYKEYLPDGSALLGSIADQALQYVALINEVIKEVESMRCLGEPCRVLEIFRVRYQDSVPMLTIGWWILPPSRVRAAKRALKGCVGIPGEHDEIEEVRYASLTRAEKRFIEKHLGNSALQDLIAEHRIPHGEAKDYIRYHRFSPSYAELEW